MDFSASLLLAAAAPAVMLLGGLISLLFCRHSPRAASAAGCTAVLAGSIMAACFLFTRHLHPLLLFQLPILLLGAAGAVHSLGYLRGHGAERAWLYWFFYPATVAAMFTVTLLNQPLPFLVVWELMGLVSFALVAFEYREEETRHASWIYLLACEAGGLFLVACFTLSPGPVMQFILALLGFGLKIGFPLLHVWLPKAHPAAPAPVSALMSGAMIPLGFLGLCRFGILPPNQGGDWALYGTVLLSLGIAAALGGILFAMTQTNIKALLAYSSIENMGLIAIGLGLYALTAGQPGLETAAHCALTGAGLHLLNHALLKGGLFLGAGTVLKTTGTLHMEHLGGLLRRQPLTGSLFILNACGLCGLPPLNGFFSEFLLYLAALAALPARMTAVSVAATAALIALALTGGIAAAAYAKLCGAVFLGEPRSPQAETAAEAPKTMTLPVLCLLLLGAAVSFLSGRFAPQTAALPLRYLFLTSAFLCSLTLLLYAIRRRFLPRVRTARNACTWDCGYAAPTARMEYTGTAFIQPLADFFRPFLRSRRSVSLPEGDVPDHASFETETPDTVLTGVWQRLFRIAGSLADAVHRLQSGNLHLYILWMTLALLAMLIWGLLLPWGGHLLTEGGLFQ